MPIFDPSHPFQVGDRVEKIGGDYYFEGVVVSVFSKLSGEVRYVVENGHGVLHIYNGKQLRHKKSEPNSALVAVKTLLDRLENDLCRLDSKRDEMVQTVRTIKSLVKV